MNSNLTRLLDAAKAATPGPWEAPLKRLTARDSDEGNNFSNGDYEVYPPLGEAGPVAILANSTDAAFIAAFNPETAVKLIEVITLQRDAIDLAKRGIWNASKKSEKQADAILETLGNGEAR